MLGTRKRAGFIAFSTVTVLLFGTPAFADPATSKEPATRSAAVGAPDSKAIAAHARLDALAKANSALGVYFDNAASQFVVVLPATGAGSRASAADFSVAGFGTRVHRSAVTQTAIDAVNSNIQRAVAQGTTQQYGFGSYFDLARDVMVIETDAPAEVVADLTRGFTGKVEHRYGTVRRDTRQSDPPPFWGGASITDGGGICSSGFVVRNGAGTRFMVTAGHCFLAGAAVRSTGGGFAMGTVVNRAPFPAWDMELLGGASYGTFVYRGDLNGVGIHVVAAADPVVNFLGYCRSGQTTAENCNQRTTSLTAQLCDASGCTNDMISYNNGGLSAGGDSGAPYYIYSVDNASVHIRGIHIGRIGSTMYAEKWSKISARFGVSIQT